MNFEWFKNKKIEKDAPALEKIARNRLRGIERPNSDKLAEVAPMVQSMVAKENPLTSDDHAQEDAAKKVLTNDVEKAKVLGIFNYDDDVLEDTITSLGKRLEDRAEAVRQAEASVYATRTEILVVQNKKRIAQAAHMNFIHAASSHYDRGHGNQVGDSEGVIATLAKQEEGLNILLRLKERILRLSQENYRILKGEYESFTQPASEAEGNRFENLN